LTASHYRAQSCLLLFIVILESEKREERGRKEREREGEGVARIGIWQKFLKTIINGQEEEESKID